MGIGSINDYAGILQNYRVPVIRDVSLDAVRSQEEQNINAVSPAAEVSHEAPAVSLRERKDAPLEDISITFNKEDNFGYIGKDKDIRSLDVEKAIDDMKKDKVLQQYQYFVGSSRNLMMENEDGTVIQKLM
ncbi:MAG: hypothetical protein ACI4AB_05110 [Acetatifactor sp.]